MKAKVVLAALIENQPQICNNAASFFESIRNSLARALAKPFPCIAEIYGDLLKGVQAN
jgi:hypothetical protein